MDAAADRSPDANLHADTITLGVSNAQCLFGPDENRSDEEEMKRWLTIILLLVWSGIAFAQTTPPMCALTGNIANADGSPYVGVIKFYNPIVQVINNIPINPMQVSTGTTPAGAMQPISLPQGAFFQVTMCPSASASSGCAATFTAIVPASPTANFGNMAMGTNLSPSIVASSLSVTGTSSFSGTMTFPDGSTYTTAGHNNMKALGIGQAAGADLIDATSNFNGGANVIISNPNAGTQAQATLEVNTGSGPTELISFGSGFNANAVYPANSGALVTGSPNGLRIGTLTAPNSVQVVLASATVGDFTIAGPAGTPDFEGLALTGYAPLAGGPYNPITAFAIGNGYITGQTWAGLGISGAARFDGTNWHADGGAGSGAELFNFYAGSGAFYYAPGVSAGTLISAWYPEFTFDPNGLHAVHFMNEGSAAVPSLSSGSLAAGSRDTFGEVDSAASPLTITFGKPFATNAYCVFSYAGGGTPQIWQTTVRSTTAVTLQCQLPSGAACAATGGLDYFCFGLS